MSPPNPRTPKNPRFVEGTGMAKPSDGPCELRFDYIYFTENLKLLEVKQWLGVSKEVLGPHYIYWLQETLTDGSVPLLFCCFNHIQNVIHEFWNEGLFLSWHLFHPMTLQDADTYADATDLWWALWNITKFVASFGSFVTRREKNNSPSGGWVACNSREPSTIATIKDLHGFIMIYRYLAV